MISSPESPMVEESETETETVTLPRSIVGEKPVKAGDVIKVRVTEIDDENGVLKVEYAEEATPKKMGIEAMASEFDEEPQSTE